MNESCRDSMGDDTRRIPHLPLAPSALAPTGKERWNALVALERIACRIRSVVLRWTDEPKTHLPEHYEWAKDLRRGRNNVYGGLFRLFDAMARRSEGNDELRTEARADALSVINDCREYVDVKLPAPKAVIPMHYGVPMRESVARDERRA